MKGIIMAGGMGSRLRPLTCNLPKPMVPIFNKPVAEYGVELLNKYGIQDVGFTLFYLPDKIIDYFGDGKDFQTNAKYYIEDRPLGTGGSVRNALEFLDTTIIVISGDALTDIDLNEAYEFHKEKGSKATLILQKEPVPLEYGVVVVDDYGKVIRFLEKPSWGEVFSDTVNTGIYILEPEVFSYFELGENFDFSKDLFPKLLKDKIPMYGYIAKGYWSDVGNISSYMQTHMDIFKDKEKHFLLGKEQEEGIWIGKRTIIERGAKIYPPVYIGDYSTIEEGAVIEAYTVIGNNTRIGGNTSIKRSIIWDNVNISRGCEIRKAVICNDVYIGERSRVFEGVVIGSYSKIYKDSTISPNIKIWPHKIIYENAEVKNNLIWGKSTSKKLFGDRNIWGIFNEDISPELAVKLGIAFSNIMNRKGTYLISSDEYNLSKSIKNAIVSGILSTGSNVTYIKNSTTPMCRFGIKKFKLDGGIHIRGDGFYEDMISIEFFDRTASNIDRDVSKKIEKSLIDENFKRTVNREIEEDVSIEGFSTLYLNEGKALLRNIEAIKRENFKLVLYSSSKNISILAESYFKSLACNVEILQSEKDLKIEDIKKIVLKKSADLGILFLGDGEDVELTNGYNIVKDEYYYLLSMFIGLERGGMTKAVVPYHYPRVAEKLIKKYKSEVIFSKSNFYDVIQTIIDQKVELQYILNHDGICALGIILDYFVENETNLNEVLKKLPEYFYMKKEIACKWSDKGNIIRRLSQVKENDLELIEGVRFIEEKGWVLIIPDSVKPTLNLYIEGYSKVYVEELWGKYNKKLKDMIESLSNIS